MKKSLRLFDTIMLTAIVTFFVLCAVLAAVFTMKEISKKKQTTPANFSELIASKNKKYYLIRDEVFNRETAQAAYYVYVYDSKNLTDRDKELEPILFNYLRLKNAQAAKEKTPIPDGNLYFLDVSDKDQYNTSIIGDVNKLGTNATVKPRTFHELELKRDSMPALLEIAGEKENNSSTVFSRRFCNGARLGIEEIRNFIRSKMNFS